MQQRALDRQYGGGEPSIDQFARAPESGDVGGIGYKGEEGDLEPEHPARVQTDGHREAAGPFAGHGEHPADQSEVDQGGEKHGQMREAAHHLGEHEKAGPGTHGIRGGWAFHEMDPGEEAADDGGCTGEGEGPPQGAEDGPAEEPLLDEGDGARSEGGRRNAVEPLVGRGCAVPIEVTAERLSRDDETEGGKAEGESEGDRAYPGRSPTHLVQGVQLKGSDEGNCSCDGQDDQATIDVTMEGVRCDGGEGGNSGAQFLGTLPDPRGEECTADKDNEQIAEQQSNDAHRAAFYREGRGRVSSFNFGSFGRMGLT